MTQTRRIRWMLTAALVVLVAAPAPAQQRPFSVELAPFVGYRMGGSLRNTLTNETFGINEAVSYGGVVEARLKAGNRLWLLYSRAETEVDTLGGTVPFSISYIQVGGSRDMSGQGAVRPFVAGSLGFGIANGEGTQNAGKTKFGLGAALGIKAPPSSTLTLRAEVRGFLTFVGEQDAFGTCGAQGCAIAFSSNTLLQGELAVGFGLRF